LKYSTFPSDVALAFSTAYAVITVCDLNGSLQQIPMSELIKVSLLRLSLSSLCSFSSPSLRLLQLPEWSDQFMILNVTLQESLPYSPLPESINTVAETFKICIREHNAHAQVNAGFHFEIVHDQFYRSLPLSLSLLLYFCS
jgi:hypothetical protein